MPVPEYSITSQNASEKRITESGERIRVISRYYTHDTLVAAFLPECYST
jgi:hypothetical protein